MGSCAFIEQNDGSSRDFSDCVVTAARLSQSAGSSVQVTEGDLLDLLRLDALRAPMSVGVKCLGRGYGKRARAVARKSIPADVFMAEAVVEIVAESFRDRTRFDASASATICARQADHAVAD
jgi:hypothetical protein